MLATALTSGHGGHSTGGCISDAHSPACAGRGTLRAGSMLRSLFSMLGSLSVSSKPPPQRMSESTHHRFQTAGATNSESGVRLGEPIGPAWAPAEHRHGCFGVAVCLVVRRRAASAGCSRPARCPGDRSDRSVARGRPGGSRSGHPCELGAMPLFLASRATLARESRRRSQFWQLLCALST